MAPARPRNEVGIEMDRVTNVTSTDFPQHWPGEDHSWDLDYFKKTFKVDFRSREGDDMEFDLIGLDASIANAFRRILISEIPTMAIEYVFVINNTSVIQDEVLAHRLGLIPIRAHPDRFAWFQKPAEGEEPNHTDYDTVVLTLDQKCERNPDAAEGEKDPLKAYTGAHVYSRDLQWQPKGQQEEWFADAPVEAVNPNILIAKLRPGQEIQLQLYAVLGIGKDHAKFSPVSTASYRLLPVIRIMSPIVGRDALKFQKCFPQGVIELVKNADGEDEARVADARKDTVSRECLRHEEFQGKVQLGRVRDHFIFSIESTGVMTPDELFRKSVAVLRQKAIAVKQALEAGRR
ncbi:DNA-directed RNA polymerase core subunit rpc40 [Saitoella coloradoensis]